MDTNYIDIKILKRMIESSHINFLFGSGLSRPYLSVLGNKENDLTELAEKKDSEEEYKGEDGEYKYKKDLISIYSSYFNSVIFPNHKDFYLEKINNNEINSENISSNTEEENTKEDSEDSELSLEEKYEMTFNNYKSFLEIWNQLLLKRHSSILNKQINVFTTNIDLFVERAAEFVGVELNDGFSNHRQPIYDEGNFSKIYQRVSSLYSNSSEVPVFNLMKLHGSVDWRKLHDDDKDSLDITCDDSLKTIENVHKSMNNLYLNNEDFSSDDKEKINNTLGEYDKFIMVNPTKAKFKKTLIDLHFYELMRLYSNALERTNSVLFVAGFSFADEHIAKITVRAANSNPTLMIFVFAYDKNQVQALEGCLEKGGHAYNNNIKILTPGKYFQKKNEDSVSSDSETTDSNIKEDTICFDFKSINELVFKPLLDVRWENVKKDAKENTKANDGNN